MHFMRSIIIFFFLLVGSLLAAVLCGVLSFRAPGFLWGCVIFSGLGLVFCFLLFFSFRKAAVRMERKLEETLESAKRLAEEEKLSMVGEVSAGLAHEIRNPLSAVVSGMSLLASGRRTPEEQERIIRMVNQEVSRLNTVLTDFLVFARAQSPPPVKVDLNGLVREIAGLAEDDPGLRGDSEVVLELGEVPRIMFADEELRQLIWHLVLNGLQAMRGRGRLGVRTWTEGERWFLEVEDSGPGIPKELSERIFAPFFSTKKEGAGLGLSIVRRVIRNHGGEVWHEPAPGGGTRFVVSAPLSGPGGESEQAGSRA